MLGVDTELVPVRVEDWLALGRLVDRAAARGYFTLFALFNKLRDRGVMIETGERALEIYKQWDAGKQFRSIMDDRESVQPLDRRWRVLIGDLEVEIEETHG